MTIISVCLCIIFWFSVDDFANKFLSTSTKLISLLFCAPPEFLLFRLAQAYCLLLCKKRGISKTRGMRWETLRPPFWLNLCYHLIWLCLFWWSPFTYPHGLLHRISGRRGERVCLLFSFPENIRNMSRTSVFKNHLTLWAIIIPLINLTISRWIIILILIRILMLKFC